MATTTLDQRLAAAQAELEPISQGHLLRFYDQLSDEQKDRLLNQIEQIDWPLISRLIETHVKQAPDLRLPDHIEPAPWYAYKPRTKEQRERYRRARKQGETLIKKGKVAAFTVAGGQGTRLGWDGPKGSFPATPIRKLPLFACLAEYIRNVQHRYDAIVPWYIMTSPINDQATRDFFDQHGYFGLDPSNVMMFPQGMLPAIEPGGRVLLEQPDSLALSPNGHGGSLQALYTSGALDDMRDRGVEQISYTQIDNPLVKVVDPLFIGLHHMDQAQMSSKMLPKAYPKEKLGNFCMVDGRVTVIEYSDLPDELAQQRLEDGTLRFRAGSIAIHVMRRDFVEQLNKGGDFSLPYHRALKKVPHLDWQTGQPVEPAEPNAVKLETFVFDALPLCERSVVYETDRIEEFAPIKNADAQPIDSSVDSPWTSAQIQVERAARWLAAHQVGIPRTDEGQVDAVIEISQLTAIEAADLKKVDLPDTIEPGTQVLL